MLNIAIESLQCDELAVGRLVASGWCIDVIACWETHHTGVARKHR